MGGWEGCRWEDGRDVDGSGMGGVETTKALKHILRSVVNLKSVTQHLAPVVRHSTSKNASVMDDGKLTANLLQRLLYYYALQ